MHDRESKWLQEEYIKPDVQLANLTLSSSAMGEMLAQRFKAAHPDQPAPYPEETEAERTLRVGTHVNKNRARKLPRKPAETSEECQERWEKMVQRYDNWVHNQRSKERLTNPSSLKNAEKTLMHIPSARAPRRKPLFEIYKKDRVRPSGEPMGEWSKRMKVEFDKLDEDELAALQEKAREAAEQAASNNQPESDLHPGELDPDEFQRRLYVLALPNVVQKNIDGWLQRTGWFTYIMMGGLGSDGLPRAMILKSGEDGAPWDYEDVIMARYGLDRQRWRDRYGAHVTDYFDPDHKAVTDSMPETPPRDPSFYLHPQGLGAAPPAMSTQAVVQVAQKVVEVQKSGGPAQIAPRPRPTPESEEPTTPPHQQSSISAASHSSRPPHGGAEEGSSGPEAPSSRHSRPIPAVTSQGPARSPSPPRILLPESIESDGELPHLKPPAPSKGKGVQQAPKRDGPGKKRVVESGEEVSAAEGTDENAGQSGVQPKAVKATSSRTRGRKKKVLDPSEGAAMQAGEGDGDGASEHEPVTAARRGGRDALGLGKKPAPAAVPANEDTSLRRSGRGRITSTRAAEAEEAAAIVAAKRTKKAAAKKAAGEKAGTSEAASKTAKPAAGNKKVTKSKSKSKS